MFTPNGDGVQDMWQVDDIVGTASVRIYNRWGNLVFENLGGYDESWDGKYNGANVPVGVYYYVIELNNPAIPLNEFSGTVQVLR